MPIAASMLPEIDNEMKTTRSLLAVVPDGTGDWKPHAKSMSLGQLAIHIPNLVSMIPLVTGQRDLDVMTAGNMPKWESAAKTLTQFDAALATGRAAIAGLADDAMMTPWTFRRGDHVIFQVPRVAALRSFILNHLIHHRGQLSVYLRLLDVPLPSIYGPTADTPV